MLYLLKGLVAQKVCWPCIGISFSVLPGSEIVGLNEPSRFSACVSRTNGVGPNAHALTHRHVPINVGGPNNTPPPPPHPRPKGFGLNNLGSVTPWTTVRQIGGSWVALEVWVALTKLEGNWGIPEFLGWLGWRVYGSPRMPGSGSG